MQSCETCQGTDVQDTYANAVLHTFVDGYQTWLQCTGLRMDALCREQERVPVLIASNTLMSDQPHDSFRRALHMHTLFALWMAIPGILSSLCANDTILLCQIVTSTVPSNHLHLQLLPKASIPYLRAFTHSQQTPSHSSHSAVAASRPTPNKGYPQCTMTTPSDSQPLPRTPIRQRGPVPHPRNCPYTISENASNTTGPTHTSLIISPISILGEHPCCVTCDENAPMCVSLKGAQERGDKHDS
jgi:hypothetical protein